LRLGFSEPQLDVAHEPGGTLLAVALPMQLAGFLSGRIVGFLWIPMALYEVSPGTWLAIKGVPRQGTRQRQSVAHE